MNLRHFIDLAVLLRPTFGGVFARRLLPSLVVLVVLSVVAGGLACVVLGVGLVAFYSFLLAYQISEAFALLLVALVALVMLLGVALAIRYQLCRTRRAVRPTTGLQDIADAFMDGFNQTER